MRYALILLGVVIFALIPQAHSQGINYWKHEHQTRAFVPNCLVEFEFAWSDIRWANVTSSRGSDFEQSTSPSRMTFFTDEVDRFNITFWVKYDLPANQTIYWNVKSGGEPWSADSDTVFARTLRLTVIVDTEKKPEYPTPLEIAQAQAGYYKTLEEQIGNATKKIETVQEIVLIVAIFATFILILVFTTWYSGRREH